MTVEGIIYIYFTLHEILLKLFDFVKEENIL